MIAQSRIAAPLDPGFQPAVLMNRNYVATANASGRAVPLVLGLERESGLLSRFETVVKPKPDHDTLRYVERLVKFLLWAWGGWRLYVAGPRYLGHHIAQEYSNGGRRAFDADLMSQVYERPFEVALADHESVPAAKETSTVLGGHLEGCRLGFDLGASDFKVAALNEGKVVYSDEFPWNPKEHTDPEYHYTLLNEGLHKAAAYLPRVDAIGGSSAGVIVGNKIMVASLFRSVPAGQFSKARDLFLRLRDEWRVPLEVANDGDVTALAGAMSVEAKGMLGVAMGSSEAAGYINPRGCMTGWLNELAFAPVDYQPNAAVDEWSDDKGVGALYFSQQAVAKLLPAAGIELPGEMGLPDRLKHVQALMAQGDARAAAIYQTVGVYLGYAIAHYSDFYDFAHALILGRVTTGEGGDIILAEAREVLQTEFPILARKIQLGVPDEKSRRVGQAVAAASLPTLPTSGPPHPKVGLGQSRPSSKSAGTGLKHDVRAVAREFLIHGAFQEACPYGNGHINDTYCVRYDQAGIPVRYIFQRVNHNVFKDPDALMQNVQRVTAHVAAKLHAAPDASRGVLTLIPTRNGRVWHHDEAGNCWRVYLFIENARTYDAVQSPRQAFEAARAFGRFQKLLADLPAPRLHDTIPDFHHTPKRFARLEQAIAANTANRAGLAGREIEFALQRQGDTNVLLRAGLPERVTHNDTKLNNVMLDDATGEGVCVIDLDTVMPGLALYDFGDMVRTTTSPAREDELNLANVTMQFPMFEALVRGYLTSAGELLTKEEKQLLAFAGKLITFEIGIRFLTDFLEGDTYFKVHRENHNLDRCRTQFRLVESIEQQEAAMNRLVEDLS
jgi:predicted NBD/HSP70 family sugar kinase